MTENTNQWFIDERSRVLALMYLSRRTDLVIKDVKDRDIGLDFMVSILKANETRPVRQFGIALKGSTSPLTIVQLNEALRPAIESFQDIGQFPYPIGLVYFTMQDDRGYFTWLAEPRVAEGGPLLLFHSEPHCHPFDTGLLDRIVEAVDRWYDAFFARIAVKAS